ncbi:MAG: RAMP superfamily CRISPR-associated protein [Bacillota bacterium]
MNYKNKIIKYKIELENNSNFIIGTGEEGIENLLIRNNHLVIPATTISGLFRSYLKKHCKDENLYKAVFLEDFENSIEKKANKKYRKKSIISFEDSYSKNQVNYKKDISSRSHIKIDKHKGVSKENHLFTNYYVNKKSKKSFIFNIEIKKFFDDISYYNKQNEDIKSINERDERLISDLQEYLEKFIKKINQGVIRFGSNTNKGFGQFKILKIGKKEYNLSKAKDANSYINNEKVPLEDYISDKKSEEIYRINFTCPEGILIKGDIREISIDNRREKTKTVQMHYKENNKYIIPSSTVKGLFRNYFSKVLRDEERIDILFGSDERKGQLGFFDVLLKENIKVNKKIRNRIKIDRFTGSAINGALLSERPISINEKREIKIDLSKVKNDINKDIVRKVLKLFEIELKNEKIRIGSNQSIGYGKLEA